MQEQLDALLSAARAELAAAADDAALEQWRVTHLGRRSELTGLLRSVGSLPREERRAAGQAANAARRELEAAFEDRQAELRRGADGAQVDVTMPGYPVRLGSLHPLTRTLREIRRVLAPLGFRAVSGPEVEWDRYNFELLNIPADHPARDMWDTFHIDDKARPGELLLRTHTSPVQARVMEQIQPPVRVIVPGKVYRYEDRDASHEAEFMQVEGLAIDKHITMADLRGTLTYFVRAMFGPDRELRIRASYFPFTEPSAEAEMSCHVVRRRRLRGVRRDRLDRNSGFRHGASEGPGRRGLRPRRVPGLRFRHGRGADCHAQVRGDRYPVVLPQRPAVPAAVALSHASSLGVVVRTDGDRGVG